VTRLLLLALAALGCWWLLRRRVVCEDPTCPLNVSDWPETTVEDVRLGWRW
jgi:hypothetical protein